MPEPTPAPTPVDRERTLVEIEVPVILDMLHFALAHADFVSRALEGLHEPTRGGGELSDAGRRAFLVAVFREEMQAYENLGAVLWALGQYAQGARKTVLDGILGYDTPDAFIGHVLTDEVVTAIREKAVWNVSATDLARAGFARGRTYLLDGLFAGATEFGTLQGTIDEPKYKAYNKIKHGSVFMLHPRHISSGIPEGVPAAIFKHHDPAARATTPFVVYGLHPSPGHPIGGLTNIHFATFTARILLAMYLWSQHRMEVVTRVPDFANLLPADVRVDLAALSEKGFGNRHD